jgi:fatty acid desaturase
MIADTYKVAGDELVADLEPSWTALGRYGRANLVVTVAQVVAWAALLTALDRPSLHWGFRAAALVLFCLMMQGVFTMLHEFCHRNAHRDPRWNYVIGWITSTIFGTVPTLLQVQHWSHHRRNRTAPERGEFIHEDERPWEKIIRYYASILGGLWAACFFFALLVPFIPFSAIEFLMSDRRFNYLSAAFDGFKAADWPRMRIEGVVFIAWCVVLVWFGPWSWQTLLLAYVAFAFSWSSLQWIYHLYTPLHKIEGAYNLRAPALVRVLFLNFNWNLTHHRQPGVPWQELPRHVDPAETQPLWYRWLYLFRPPIPFPTDPAIAERMLEKRYF